MATSTLTELEQPSDSNVPLSTLVNTEQFPFIIQVSESDEISKTFGVAKGTKILIQSLLCLDFAQVRPLGIFCENKGAAHDQRNSEATDGVYLLSTKCKGQVRFISLPDDSGKYSSIEQVIQHSPVYVKTDEDVIIGTQNGAESNFVLPKKTLLKVVRTFFNDNRLWLEFRHGKRSYVFHDEEQVKLRLVKDDKLYSLYELSRVQLLPRVVKFTECQQNNIQYLDHRMNQEMADVLKMPLHLLGFVNIKLLVGWVRDKPRRTYETVVIHNKIWERLLVHKISVKDTMRYIKRKYGKDTDLDFVEKTTLIMPLGCTKFLWLGSPKLFKRDELSAFQLEAIDTKFEDSSDDNSGDGGEGENDESEKKVPRTVDLPNVKLKRSLFAKVHAEILSWFRPSELNRNKSSRKTIKEKRSATLDSGRQKRRNIRTRYKTIPAAKMSSNEHSITNDLDLDSWTMSTARSQPSRTNRSFFDISMEQKGDELFSSAIELRRYVAQQRSTEPIKHDVTKDDISTSIHVDRPNPCGSSIDPPDDSESNETSMDIQGYLRMDIDVWSEIMKKGSTAEEFYKFSVVQTALCFRLCALCRFADQCYINRLNGMFFKNLDLEILKDDPFYLNSIQILKVDKIINQGWRSGDD